MLTEPIYCVTLYAELEEGEDDESIKAIADFVGKGVYNYNDVGYMSPGTVLIDSFLTTFYT